MPSVEAQRAGAVMLWQRPTLDKLVERLATKPWTRDVLLRGSLARGQEDAVSDLDVVVTVDASDFADSVRDLARGLPLETGARMAPWVDGLVRDFGGLGFVYLLEVSPGRWGQIDVYVLPHDHRMGLLGHGPVLTMWSRQCATTRPSAGDLDVDRYRHERISAALRDCGQALMGCYVATFLLRKRLERGQGTQTFADTYLLAQAVRDLLVVSCHPQRPEHGWHGLGEVIRRSPEPAEAQRAFAVFTSEFEPKSAPLATRVAALELLTRLLGLQLSADDHAALRGLGGYLSNPVGRA